MTDYQNADTAIGIVEVAASELGLCRVSLLGRNSPSLHTPAVSQSSKAGKQYAKEALNQIMEFLQGKIKVFSLNLDWTNITAFQKKVLQAALTVPFGEIRTYGQLANSIGQAQASRAVGAALGRNPMPIVIPCHRIIAASGHLTGFSAADGLQTKQWLLELEGHSIVHQKLG
jgi:methylated-DNA-[protein]-cysteine S-methyltransferase